MPHKLANPLPQLSRVRITTTQHHHFCHGGESQHHQAGRRQNRRAGGATHGGRRAPRQAGPRPRAPHRERGTDRAGGTQASAAEQRTAPPPSLAQPRQPLCAPVVASPPAMEARVAPEQPRKRAGQAVGQAGGSQQRARGDGTAWREGASRAPGRGAARGRGKLAIAQEWVATTYATFPDEGFPLVAAESAVDQPDEFG